jgi:hypothetical protein
MPEPDTDDGFDAEVKDADRVHLERLSSGTIAVNVYLKDGSVKVFTLGSETRIAIRAQNKI